MNRLVFLFVYLFLSGCTGTSNPDPVGMARERIEAPIKSTFFCDWDSQDSAFQKAILDYAKGNRRSSEAWRVIYSKDQPGVIPKEQGVCWHGALLYVGIFGSRDELPKLVKLLKHDPLLETEVDLSLPVGATVLGQERGVALHYAGFQALAAQIRRQRIFGDAMNEDAKTAQALIQKCAFDHTMCMPSVDMHLYSRQLLQRSAVRGLAISGTESDLDILKAIRSNLGAYHSMMMPAVGHADFLIQWINENMSFILSSVPAP